MIAAPTIRAMNADDVPALTGVLARAYESAQDFALRLNSYLGAARVATFVADLGGEPVGMVVGNDYGPLSYVSQMAVDPAFWRRGFGTALMDALIAWAESTGFGAVELDATPAGAPLYARYGFRIDGETLVFEAPRRGGYAGAARRYHPADRAALFAADAHAIGGDRSEVLAQLIDAESNVILVDGPDSTVVGYAIAQLRSGQLGPVVAATAGVARRLMDAARAHLPPGHRISVPSNNRAVQELLAERGYRFARPLAHMVRGTPVPAARERLFARINLGQG